MVNRAYFLRWTTLRLLRESSQDIASCLLMSRRWSLLIENGNIFCLPLNRTRPFLSRCPQEKWTSQSNGFGLTGTRRPRSFSFSSASNFLTQETQQEPQGLLLQSWCLHLLSLSLHHQHC